MRTMSLDVGDERIGVAISDVLGRLARPLEVIARRPGPSSFTRIAEIVAAYEVSTIVMGLPLLPDGSEGKQTHSTQAYVRGLMRYVNLPIVYLDERDSTRRAAEILAVDRASRRRRHRTIDAVSAAVILQSYLDGLSGGVPS